MKYLRLLSRLILGATFLFSGFVKAVDPLGSAYKLADYFTAFGLGFLDFLAPVLGILLSAFELILGLALITGYLRKAVAVVNFWFMSFFTVLTLILAIFNPVHDCGCFGDALILTNWQTFFKNVFLMIFVLILFYGRKAEKPGRGLGRQAGLLVAFSALAILFTVWNYQHLPLVDFRPYSIGTRISDEMDIPEDAPPDVYETSLVYKNRETGKEEEFSLENYPKDTASWVFVNSESVLVSKGFEPAIQDFAIMDKEGFDLADEILSFDGYTLLMIAYDLGHADEVSLKEAWGWSKMALFSSNFQFLAVTASSSVIAAETRQDLGLGYSFYYGDEIMLKTVVRSSPGYLLIKNGVIVSKWAYRDFMPIGELAPEWMELIGNAAVPFEDELMKESFDFDFLDFDSIAPELIYKASKERSDRRVIGLFLLAVVVTILLSSKVESLKL